MLEAPSLSFIGYMLAKHWDNATPYRFRDHMLHPGFVGSDLIVLKGPR